MFELRCPGKVFLLGEYACLEGFPALVGTLAPEFSLRLTKDGFHPFPFAPESPAGRYLSRHADRLAEYSLEWVDPYHAPIGVGSSSAQFVLAVEAVACLEDRPRPSPIELLQLYREITDTVQAVRPSGADVVAQATGGVVLVHGDDAPQSLPPWKAEGVFLLAFTGRKTKTHEHLSELKARGFPGRFAQALRELGDITRNGAEAWDRGDAVTFGKSLMSYQRALAAAGLAPADFTAAIERAAGWPGVIGCKGSGAQGGDCALFLVENRAKEDVRARILEVGWEPRDVRWSSGRA